MTSEVEVQLAALRAANLTGDEAEELARGMIAEDLYTGNETVRRLGYRRSSMKAAERYTIAAAALLLTAEFASLTPFQQWFKRSHTPEERDRFTERDLMMMEIGFTQYGRR